ncbi:UTRA domain-containing protein [Niallia sp. NCCP-28]|uniref:UTRA domain-containing protein n=1 Tax=Niallia sp. NCCP-28 TaxID=2934712 RepID=UPI002085D36D|nr:UTRA domain-containing protein [Niallia sp. NCCP-28]GKU83509.1 GntR family transcriptional regulator [Niallia sp. NCCP-28]
MKLNNDSKLPLYFQLKQVIKEDIKREKYKSGEKLPTEAELCEIYGVSRITSRRAIKDLVEEGILHSHQGKGIYVKSMKEKRELISAGGFSELTISSGKRPSSQILSSIIINMDEELAGKFKLPIGERVLNLHRLLFIEDDEPFIIETSYFPLVYFPNLERHIGESTSTYSILKERYNTDITRSSKILEGISASAYEAELFKCDAGTALFSIEKLSFDQQDRAVHLSTSLFMTNKVIFTIDAEQNK